MATGGADDDTDLYTCQVCLEDQTKRTPRLLSCHHSFCQDCIKKLVKEGKVECPTCRKLTLIAEDDVAELSMNFMLMKMKEHMDKMLSNKNILCHVCRKTTADRKCCECSNLLCEPCTLLHKSYEGFKDHQILLVCPEHQEGVMTHVCLHCVEGTCSICLLNKHADHKDEVVLYKEGVFKIRESIAKLQEAIQNKLLPMKEGKEKYQEKMKEGENIERKVVALHSSYVDKCEEVKILVDQIQIYNKAIRDGMMRNEKAKEHFDELAKTLLESDDIILNAYPKLRNVVNKDLETDERDLVELFGDNELYLEKVQKLDLIHAERTMPAAATSENKKGFLDASLVYETSDFEMLSIVNPSRIQCVKPEKVIIFDSSSWMDASIDRSKQPVKILTTKYNCDFNDAVYSKGHVWYQQDEAIIQVALHTSKRKTYFSTNIKRIGKLFQGISSNMIIYDNIAMRVYEYCNNQIKKVASDMNVDHVAVQKINSYPAGYIVTNTFESSLTFYNRNWAFQGVLYPSENKGPSECISTPMGLLVANTGNNCVTLLDNQGELVEECVVGEKEGIRHPVSIDYMEPYLWIAEYDKYEGHRSIKCFELRPNH